MERRSAPAARRCVANECRSACGEAWRETAAERTRPVQDAPHAAVRQAAGARVQEDDLGVPRGGREGRPLLQPGAESRGGWLAERHDALLAPLSDRAHLPGGEVHVLEAQADELRDAQSRRVEELEERAVARAERPLAPLRLDDRPGLGDGERPGQRLLVPGRPHRLRRVRRHAPLALEEREERPERREVPSRSTSSRSLRRAGERDTTARRGGRRPRPGARPRAGSRRRRRETPQSARDPRRTRTACGARRGARLSGGGRTPRSPSAKEALFTMTSSPGSGPRRRAP